MGRITRRHVGLGPGVLAPVALLILAGAALGTAAAAEPGAGVWIDPSTLPFVPRPVVTHAFAPLALESSCEGSGSYSPGPRPAYVDDVVLQIQVFACRIESATIAWTLHGETYSGSVDVDTGAVSQIHKVAQDPRGYGDVIQAADRRTESA